MGFYRQTVAILRPARIESRYTDGRTHLDYDTEKGATRTEVPFGVELQPRNATEVTSLGRIETQTGWWMSTPPGRDIDLTEVHRVTYDGRDLNVVGEVQRWPSSRFPSGVDHVEVALEFVDEQEA